MLEANRHPNELEEVSPFITIGIQAFMLALNMPFDLCSDAMNTCFAASNFSVRHGLLQCMERYVQMYLDAKPV